MNMVNEILTKSGWSQAALGSYLKIAQTTVSRWANGTVPVPYVASIVLQDLKDRLDRGEQIPKPSRSRDAPHEPDIIT